jgi:hypothetical protein
MVLGKLDIILQHSGEGRVRGGAARDPENFAVSRFLTKILSLQEKVSI